MNLILLIQFHIPLLMYSLKLIEMHGKHNKTKHQQTTLFWLIPHILVHSYASVTLRIILYTNYKWSIDIAVDLY